jgi:hypothetical protein
MVKTDTQDVTSVKKRCTVRFSLASCQKDGTSCRKFFMDLRLLFYAGLVSASLVSGQWLHAQSTGLFVNSSNNVGIGTTTPSTNLDVSANVTEGGLTTGQLHLTGNTNPNQRLVLGYDTTNDFGFIEAGIAGTAVKNLVLAPRGANVGVGTTVPNLPLDVRGANLIARFESNAASALVYFTPSGQKQWRVGAGSVNTGDFGIRNDTDGIEAININAAGNVGIGTTSPGRPLEVAGQIYSNVAGGGSLALNGNNANSQPSIYLNRNNSSGWSVGLTSDANASFYINNSYGAGNVMMMSPSGNVGIGTATPAYKLDVAGQVHATSFVSSTQTYADFVFKPGYKLEPLRDVEASIKKDGHLPGIPSEEEAKAHGIDLTSMQVKLLQKIEELTLHQIDQEKRIEQLEKENAELRERLPNE